MHVGIVDGDVSYPTTSGKRLRTLNLLLPLAARHKLTYIGRSAGDAAENAIATAFFKDHGIEPILVDDPIARKKGLSFYLRLLSNLFSSLPYSVTSHRSAKMREAVQRFAAANRVDLWQVEWTGYLYTVAGHPAPVVLQAHNVDSLIWQRYFDAERNLLKRVYIKGQWRKFQRFEGAAFHQVQRVVAVSPEDADLAGRTFGVQRMDVVDNGVDVSAFQDVRPSLDSRCILYLGALDWRPNLDALDLLLNPIFPAVRARIPEARLVIVGRKPPDSLRKRVATTVGAELHADVPDVRPFMSACTVMAVPLRIGGGSRLKILEALAAGLPVVSTRIGAEGLCLRPGVDFTQADTNEAFVEALVEVLQQPGPALVRAHEARLTVADRYDWSILADRLERVWEKALAEAPSASGNQQRLS